MTWIVLEGRGPNTMSVPMLLRLEEQVRAAGSEPLLLTGAGTAFSAGLDLHALRDMDAAGVRDLLATIERVTLALFLHPAPTVAWVNGHAVAGGCLVVQACDLRVASARAETRIGMTGVAIGLRYPPFVFDILRSRLEPRALEEILLGARRYDVEGAHALGLLDEVVAPERAEERAQELLTERAALPRQAYAAAKLDRRRRHLTADSAAFLDAAVPSWTAALR
ncbi:MAG: enoyl-CoA hydratase/isomerase family protein [Myxococcales bacterium]|nr:enoyl-CoA hydratase/isomerase family protein [Myxococcales bacterium]